MFFLSRGWLKSVWQTISEGEPEPLDPGQKQVYFGVGLFGEYRQFQNGIPFRAGGFSEQPLRKLVQFSALTVLFGIRQRMDQKDREGNTIPMSEWDPAEVYFKRYLDAH